MITTQQVAIMGADQANAVVPESAAEAPEQPWEPWSAPVMLLAGAAPDGTPWLWLAGRCGWFLGFERQYDPDQMALSARRHRESCTECGETA